MNEERSGRRGRLVVVGLFMNVVAGLGLNVVVLVEK